MADPIICKSIVDAVREVVRAQIDFEDSMQRKFRATSQLTKELIEIGRGQKEVIVEVDGGRYFVDKRRCVLRVPDELIVETSAARDFTKE